jgi:predicted AlkP superfamily pyrophosphatase or phosphodiesterase
MVNCKKTLIIGIDGCRPDALIASDTPNIDLLIEAGVFSFHSQTSEITVSGPSWSSMLSGVWHTKHGVKDNSFSDAQFELFPHFFQRIKEVKPSTFTASLVHWRPIHTEIVTHADVSRAYISDDQVAIGAVRLLTQSEPDVLFLHFDDVDHAGHEYGYGLNSPRYIKAIEVVDTRIGVLLDALHVRKTFDHEDWLIVITTDHGGSGFTHGLNIPDHRETFLILNGLSAGTGQIKPAPHIVDVAPTVFVHMGLEIDPAWGWDGVPICMGYE